LAADGTILYASPSTERILTYPAEDFVGRTRRDLIHPDDLSQAVASLEDCVRRPGEDIQAGFRYRAKDGSCRHLEPTAITAVAAPTAAALVAQFGDVPAAIGPELQLRESQPHLSALIENTTDAIWSVDTGYRLITGNRMAFADFRKISDNDLKVGLRP